MYTVATLVETRTISWATRGQADPNSATGV
jgi:hypothetical protein